MLGLAKIRRKERAESRRLRRMRPTAARIALLRRLWKTPGEETPRSARLVCVPFERDPTKEELQVEDREKVKPYEPEDVEAHKKKGTPLVMRGDEAEAPTEGEGTDDDVELHKKGDSSKL
jgi:hypothetical protein